MHWSERVEKEAVWLSGKLPYTDVAEAMGRMMDQQLSRSSIWARCQGRGQALRVHEEKERAQANALPSLWEKWSPFLNRKRIRMGAAMDGAMVHVRDEGWKELKVGGIFEVGVQMVKDKKNGGWEKIPQAQANSYVAHLGGPAYFGELMWSEAQRRHWDLALDTQIIGDGAAWIWNLANLHFGDSIQV